MVEQAEPLANQKVVNAEMDMALDFSACYIVVGGKISVC